MQTNRPILTLKNNPALLALKQKADERKARVEAARKKQAEPGESLKNRQAAARRIKAVFPVFAKCWPLEIGIVGKLDIIAERAEVSRKVVRRFLGWHCCRVEYLRNLAKPNSYRHDLSGRVVDLVADEHRQYAAARLAEIEAKRAANKKPAPHH